MNKAAIVCLYILFLSGLMSCGDDDITLSSDYLIFGHFYGFCIGDQCVQIYKLDDKKLYEDSNKNYPRHDAMYEGAYVALDPTIYSEVKDLEDFFPLELLQETDTIIGCPDCADGGGLYVAIKNDSVQRYWLIDQMKGNVPDYLHDFMDRVNAKIDLINTLKEK